VPVPTSPQIVRKRIRPLDSCASEHPLPAGQPELVIGLQLGVHRVALGMLPPEPLSSWSRQSPPGALHCESLVQNSRHWAAVAEAVTHVKPAAQRSLAEAPQLCPSPFVPPCVQPTAPFEIPHTWPPEHPHCGLTSLHGDCEHPPDDELLDDEVDPELDELLDEVDPELLDELLDEVDPELLDAVVSVVDVVVSPPEPPVTIVLVEVDAVPPSPPPAGGRELPFAQEAAMRAMSTAPDVARKLARMWISERLRKAYAPRALRQRLERSRRNTIRIRPGPA
jgi:hypothetical protein